LTVTDSSDCAVTFDDDPDQDFIMDLASKHCRRLRTLGSLPATFPREILNSMMARLIRLNCRTLVAFEDVREQDEDLLIAMSCCPKLQVPGEHKLPVRLCSAAELDAAFDLVKSCRQLSTLSLDSEYNGITVPMLEAAAGLCSCLYDCKVALIVDMTYYRNSVDSSGSRLLAQ
jgi:hypothetical protein